MSTDLETLALRAVACPRWRWMPGMLTTYATRVNSVTRNGSPEPRLGGLIEADPLPALDDPATMGCLLALVREAWGWPHAFVEYSPQFHLPFYCNVKKRGFAEATEAEALVAALESAP